MLKIVAGPESLEPSEFARVPLAGCAVIQNDRAGCSTTAVLRQLTRARVPHLFTAWIVGRHAHDPAPPEFVTRGSGVGLADRAFGSFTAMGVAASRAGNHSPGVAFSRDCPPSGINCLGVLELRPAIEASGGRSPALLPTRR